MTSMIAGKLYRGSHPSSDKHVIIIKATAESEHYGLGKVQYRGIIEQYGGSFSPDYVYTFNQSSGIVWTPLTKQETIAFYLEN